MSQSEQNDGEEDWAGPNMEEWALRLRHANSEAELDMQKNTFTQWINHHLEAVSAP